MNTFIEPLYKDPLKIIFGWSPESGVTVASYNVYIGLVPTIANLVSLATGVKPDQSKQASTRGKIVYEAEIADVRTALSLSSDKDFSNTTFYLAITYVDNASVESSLSDSRVVTVPPTGIFPKEMKEDPTINRHLFEFSENRQRWIKVCGSEAGGIAVDQNDFYRINTVSEYTYDASGSVLTAKSYLSDNTAAGAPAKLIIYEYNDPTNPTKATKITVSDSTV